ncbi:MAG: type II secretion system protein M [Gammaproteobacteria bacterium]|nr:type II secretion system protein M [Gammaproteobacteria bacterium]
MQQWWETLALREKRIVLIGGVLLVFFVLYELVLMPIHHGLMNMQSAVQQDQALLDWMNRTSAEIKQLQGTSVNGQLVGTQALLTTTDQSVRNSAIAHNLTSIQQNNNNTVDVKFDRVSFDALTQWMVSLRELYGIEAKQVLISRLDNQGTVQAAITLEAGQA